MVLLAGLSVWAMVRVQAHLHRDARIEEGSRSVRLRVGDSAGVIEIAQPGSPRAGRARLLMRDGHASAWMEREEFAERFGEAAASGAFDARAGWWRGLLNTPSRGGLVWVLFGVFAQAVFASRVVVQWWESERRRDSVVPPVYWWLSLLGGLMLLVYFIWRTDIVGVLGQSTGVVIYARNLQLIEKNRRAGAQEPPVRVG
jgi:lipid-A-disaccharide synthase-like uncharacterized protein